MFDIHLVNPDVTDGSLAVTWCMDKASYDALKNKNKHITFVFVPVPEYYTLEYIQAKKNEFFDSVRKKKLETAYTHLQWEGREVEDGPNDIAKDSQEVKALADKYCWGDWVGIHDKGLRAMSTGTIVSHEVKFSDLIAYLPLPSAPGKYLLIAGFAEYEELRWMDIDHAEMMIDVPEAAFAADPHPWEKAWVNWMDDVAARDQCDFRRKRLWAYTLQIPIFAIDFLFRCTLPLISLALGIHGKAKDYPNIYCSFYKSFTYTLGILLEAMHNAPKYFGGYKFLYSPAVLGTLLLLFLFAPGAVSAITLGAVLWAIGIFLGISLGIKGMKYLSEEKPENSDNELLENYLVCDGNPKITSVGDLPIQKRSVKLYVQNLKSKICKPFRR